VLGVIVALALGTVGTALGLFQARHDASRARQAETQARDQRDAALKAQAEARAAEAKERRLRTKSHAQAARLAMQRGAWSKALDQLEQALEQNEADQPDPAGLRLDRVRALAALHRTDEASAAAKALAGRPDLGKHEGPLLLLEGSLAWYRDNDPSALKKIARATQLKLSRAEAAFARGMLARTSVEAAQHFEMAVDLDPFHPPANAMLISILLLTGRLDEARVRLDFARRLFPSDPTFALQYAMLLALRGNEPGRARRSQN